MLTIDTIPLYSDRSQETRDGSIELSRLLSLVSRLLIFLMQRMATAAATELFELKPVRRILLVLRRYVIALFALRALQNNVIPWHFLIP